MHHIFTDNPLDRGDTARRDEEWLRQTALDVNSKILPMWRLTIPLQYSKGSVSLRWASMASTKLSPESNTLFLGLRGGISHFAVDISQYEDPSSAPGLDSTWKFEEARTAATILSVDETGIIAQARAQIHWHSTHKYCGACGNLTYQRRGGQIRTCQKCKQDHFPRTDPVVIAVIEHNDMCLLGQSRGRLSQMSMYSALAGFVDQGESIEEAVRREVMEEAGIEVGQVLYHSSQPWPFPHSLMIGCHGIALTTDIKKDEEEMTDVRWFARADVLSALDLNHDHLNVPQPMAIAHHLIRSWAEGDVPLTEPNT
tara:strand:+ start:8779 stop:9714 length:936 start_codon:yes stop_codon:yes gene_type:complete